MRCIDPVRCAVLVGIAALGALVGCSGVQTLDRSTVETVTLAELAADPPTAAPLSPEWEPLIVSVPAGETVPLRVDVDLAFMTVEAGQNTVRFERDVQLYLGPGEAMLSFDGERWARIGDWDALKEIAGADQGSLSLGFGVSEEQGPQMTVAVGLE
jgi:hypothetical protein